MASTNRTDTLAAGSEPEYDYAGDDWEEYVSHPTLKFGGSGVRAFAIYPMLFRMLCV